MTSGKRMHLNWCIGCVGALCFVVQFAGVINAASMKVEDEIGRAIRLLEEPDREGLESAIKIFENVLNEEPLNASAHMGIVYARVLEYDMQSEKDTTGLKDALKHVEEVLRIDPAREDAYQDKSQILFYLGRKEEGIIVLEQGLKQYPESALLHEAMLSYLIQMGRIEEAEAFSALTDSGVRDSAALLVRLGYVWLSTDHTGEAKNCFGLSIHSSQSPEAWEGLAQCSIAEDEWEEAIVFLNRAIDLDPKLYKIYNDMALCYLKTGRIAEAIKWMTPYIEAFPSDLGALKNLALLYEKAGNAVKARVTWVKFRSKTDNQEEKDLAIQHIEALTKGAAE